MTIRRELISILRFSYPSLQYNTYITLYNKVLEIIDSLKQLKYDDIYYLSRIEPTYNKVRINEFFDKYWKYCNKYFQCIILMAQHKILSSICKLMSSLNNVHQVLLNYIERRFPIPFGHQRKNDYIEFRIKELSNNGEGLYYASTPRQDAVMHKIFNQFTKGMHYNESLLRMMILQEKLRVEARRIRTTKSSNFASNVASHYITHYLNNPLFLL